MLDPTMLDQLAEGTSGLPGEGLLMALFDKRVLMPLVALPQMVENETGERLAPARVRGLAKAGWFEILSSDITGTTEGFPFYIPSRLGLFLRLEREGVSSAELAAFAEQEEDLINVVLVNDEMPYDHEDDIRIVIASRLEYLEMQRTEHERLTAARRGDQPSWFSLTGDLATPDGLEAHIGALAADIASRERELKVLEQFHARGIGTLRPETQARLRKDAFKIRMLHETTRLTMVQTDRAQIASGYSHFLQFRRHSWNGLSLESFRFEDIDWHATLRSPWLEESDTAPALPIRLPGVVLRGESLSFTRRTTPAEHKRLAEQYDLDGYFKALAEIGGQRLCARCLADLPADAPARRRYCGETCRSAARAEAYRARHPGWRKADRHGLPRDLFEPTQEG